MGASPGRNESGKGAGKAAFPSPTGVSAQKYWNEKKIINISKDG